MVTFHYRPQRSCEGYVFTPVCPQGGVYLSACWDTTPPQRTRHPPGSRHPPSRPDPPRSRHPPWEQTPQSRHPPHQQTATIADGKHPTGMHSCLKGSSTFCDSHQRDKRDPIIANAQFFFKFHKKALMSTIASMFAFVQCKRTLNV